MSRLRHSVERERRDQGSSLVLALAMVVVGTMMVLPVMEYTLGVTRTNRIVSTKSIRTEAVKGGLRAALYDPAKLYSACVASGRTTAVQLGVPAGLGIRSECTTTNDAMQDVPSDQRYALATTLVGSAANIPATYVDPSRPDLDGTMGEAWCTSMVQTDPNLRQPCGRPYANNGAADPYAWMVDTATATTGSKIFAPYLPPFSNTLAYAGGYAMPGPDPCRVYFPGKYVDDVVITNSTPVYFVSGVYYFEKTLRFSGDANVVVGAGAALPCVESDAVAVADAIGAPFDAYSSGVGGTFVFGANGRLVIDNAVASGVEGIRVKFNRRLVAKTDPLAILNDISVMSVNGVWDGTQTLDLDIPGVLHVPETLVYGSSPSDPWVHSYKASTLVSSTTPVASCAPPPAAVASSCPIVDINLTTTAKLNLKIPGYVSIPQGALSLSVGAGAGANKTVSFGGGILTAQMSVPGEAPSFLQLGLLNPIVQKTFKIVTTTLTGLPKVTATALVQINETGGYAVNSWVVQAG